MNTPERPIPDTMARDAVDGLRIVARGCTSYLDQAERTILRLLDERHRLKAELAQARAEGVPFLAGETPPPIPTRDLAQAMRDLLAELPDPEWCVGADPEWERHSATYATVRAAHAALESATTPAKEDR